jgi:hypothetical protein
MRKVLVFTVLMVLLSGVAWGQTIYKHGGWTLIERPDSYSVEFVEPRSGERYSALFDRKPSGDMISVWSSPHKGHMEDPTAWKQAKGKVEALVDPNLTKTIELKIWGDSRYRLEKNELTGDYRITWRDDAGKWQFASEAVCRDCTEKNWIELLDIFRKREQVNRAWKPIR